MERLLYGHIVEVQMYRDMLENEGIECLIKNEFEEGNHAGFGSGMPGNADLFVDNSEIERATKIVNDYKAANA